MSNNWKKLLLRSSARVSRMLKMKRVEEPSEDELEISGAAADEEEDEQLSQRPVAG